MTISPINKGFFRTTDLSLAAALVHSGFGLVALDRTNPKKIQFVFHRDQFMDKTMEDYWSGKLRVGAREFFDTLKMLKSRIHDE